MSDEQPERDWFFELTDASYSRRYEPPEGPDGPQERANGSRGVVGAAEGRERLKSAQDIQTAMRALGSRNVTPPPWFLGPCIKQGDCAYFVGEGGAGKSTLVADLVTAVLDQRREAALAGAWKVNRRLLPERPTALVINAETALEADWELHLMRANAAQGYAPNGFEDVEIRKRVEFLDRDDVPVAPSTLHDQMVQLAEAIIAAGHSLVVIDPVYALFAPGSPGDDEWVTIGMQALVRRLKAASVTTLAITHPPEPGPKASLAARLKPYGSSQQKGQFDAHFGMKRAGEAAVELIKFKDRRAGWIPIKAKVRLMWNPTGGGYSQYHYVDSHWEYDNPHEFVLSAKAHEIFAQLPGEPFTSRLIEELGIRRATFLSMFSDFYEPQNLLTARELGGRGSPRQYEWTERGLRARLISIEKSPGKSGS